MSPHAVQMSLGLGWWGQAPSLLLEPRVSSLHFGADLGCISWRGQQGTAWPRDRAVSSAQDQVCGRVGLGAPL